jgi:guanylate kinase
MSQGKLIVITGPSGVGKGTLVQSLLTRNPKLYLSISATTRQPREGEVDGKNYYFLNRSQFQEMIEREDFLEWAEYAGNYYGTPRLPVEQQIKQGKTVILEIEVLGARQVKKIFPTALLLFILPPSEQVLESRLRGRGTESDEEVILRRLTKAKGELPAAKEFDYQVVNDDLEIALQSIENIINS